MIRWILVFALLVSACDKSHKTPDKQRAAEPTQPDALNRTYETPPGVTDGNDVTRHDALVNGKPRDHWIETWGPSDSQLTFRIADGAHEYQIELMNIFKQDDPETEKVEIHEDTWDEDGYTFVLWSFRKSPDVGLMAVQAMSYEDGVEF